MSNNNINTNGIGFPGLLTIVFIILKLIGKISWSWWWVLSPSWITLCIVFLFLGVFLAVGRLDK